MNSQAARLTFADFLDRLALDQTSTEEWQTLVVGHYGDEALEEVRRRCVRLTIELTEGIWHRWSASEREEFRSLASELRRDTID